jgi:hypothetical protein
MIAGELVENLMFPHAPWPPDPSRQAAFQQALQILHLIAGVSYYKAALPGRIEIEWSDSGQVNPSLANFLDETYVHGLAEFAHVNGLEMSSRISFPSGNEPAETGRSLVLPERALVAMGGGKDSIVGLHLLQQAGVEVLPICVGESPLIAETVATAGLPLLQVKRALSPRLAEMNAAGAWNGHVPVTAINSAILLCAALLYGAHYIVFANERSADEATLVNREGKNVNHQYSKSSAFESGFRKVIASQVSPDIEYFSILRPFSELEVVRRFSDLTRFHGVYSSCNRNFHLDGPRLPDGKASRWCGECPKCLFAALTLALFKDPAEVAAIQGHDLLNQTASLDGVRALCRLGSDKPFECVGEVAECRVALDWLGRSVKWREHVVVKTLAPELQGLELPPLEDMMTPATRHFIPAGIAQSLELDPA